ncbi:hypothetical protein BC6307_06570 [Sutcliffiella cohnii]|uniref:Uncharacterized protein n=1 Tax=Sutcliffiella cohnii TaxID=33932 RepID=A0A223KNI8_9BACI|nr:hypothetical protein [Sutcliffiella cohnii]AST90966.1 hypothetical protein BC6307_06570 [Sutcliffiella cohnii]
MKSESKTPKKYGPISYLSLLIGLICFFIVFVTPTRIANIGSTIGDYMTIFLTSTGIILLIVGLKRKTEKNGLAILGLILSSSLFIFWIITIILLFTGAIEFAP